MCRPGDARLEIEARRIQGMRKGKRSKTNTCAVKKKKAKQGMQKKRKGEATVRRAVYPRQSHARAVSASWTNRSALYAFVRRSQIIPLSPQLSTYVPARSPIHFILLVLHSLTSSQGSLPNDWRLRNEVDSPSGTSVNAPNTRRRLEIVPVN